jgi:hypothetical protein
MNGKKLVSLALVISVVMFCPLLEAKERQGAHLKITNKDGGQLEGELIAVKPTSLLLLSGGGSDVSADIVGIDNIKIVKKSKAVTGMLIGLGAGAVVGGIIGATEEADLFSPADHILGGAAVLGVVGLVAGGSHGPDHQSARNDQDRRHGRVRDQGGSGKIAQAGPRSRLQVTGQPQEGQS